MATLLLIVIYIAFIGLGIPDSLFGTAWPAICPELSLPVSAAGVVTVLTSGGTIVSSLLSARLIRRFGTGGVTAACTALTAAGLLGMSCAQGLGWLCLFSVPLGLGAGSIDTALNNYVALHYKATHMNFLHCFFGVGVTVSPFLMSLALSAGSWRGGYRLMAGVQAGIAALTIAALPLWGRAGHKHPGELHSDGGRAVPFRTLLAGARVRTACAAFLGSCALETTCGGWGATWLVQARDLGPDAAAGLVTLYYLGMTAGRFLAGVLSARRSSRQLVRTGQGVVLAALVLLLLPLPVPFAGLGLFLVGMGNGPVFPNLLHLTPQLFGPEHSQSVIGLQMAASYAGILLAPAVFGALAQGAGAWLFAPYLLLFYLLMTAATLKLFQKSPPRRA